jgi:hypothetical protein
MQPCTEAPWRPAEGTSRVRDATRIRRQRSSPTSAPPTRRVAEPSRSWTRSRSTPIPRRRRLEQASHIRIRRRSGSPTMQSSSGCSARRSTGPARRDRACRSFTTSSGRDGDPSREGGRLHRHGAGDDASRRRAHPGPHLRAGARYGGLPAQRARTAALPRPRRGCAHGLAVGRVLRRRNAQVLARAGADRRPASAGNEADGLPRGVTFPL